MQHPLVDRYEAGQDKLAKSVAGLTREDLLAFPVPGTWSIQQIVLHVADTELVLAERMKRVIAQPNPLMLAYDQDAWSAGLAYEAQSVEDAAQLCTLIRRQMTRIFCALPESAMDRSGIHSEAGKKTLKDLIEMADWHVDHHLKFLFEKRKLLGKPL